MFMGVAASMVERHGFMYQNQKTISNSDSDAL